MDSNIERWYSMKEICEYLGVVSEFWKQKRLVRYTHCSLHTCVTQPH